MLSLAKPQGCGPRNQEGVLPDLSNSVSYKVACLLSLSHVHSGYCGPGPGLVPITGSLLAVVNIEPLAGRWLGTGSEAERQVLEAAVDFLVEVSRLMNAHSGLEPAV